jgi:hypothetical protein
MVLPFSVKPESGTDFVWADPIAAGDGTLVYPALQSVGYQTGVQGWRIDRNGNAEFNNGSFRGSVIVTSTNPSSVGSKVSIIPGGASDIIFTPPASVTGLTTSNGAIDHSLIDSAINGEEDLTLSSGQVNGLGQSVITMRSANVNGTPAYVQVVPNFAVAGDATVTGLTKASRWMAGVGTNSGGPPVGAVESIALIASTASGPATFKAGRAYKFELWGSFVTSVNNTDILFRIRKENGTNNPPTGQILSAGRKTGRVLAVTYDAGLTGYFIVGATDVTCDISLCIIGTASNVNLSAGATFPAEFNIYDAGDATNHNFAAVLV